MGLLDFLRPKKRQQSDYSDGSTTEFDMTGDHSDGDSGSYDSGDCGGGDCGGGDCGGGGD